MLNPDEIHELTRFRDWRSWQSIATNWGVIGAAFALVAWRPNPLTIVLALFLIGGRQLGMAVLMHEAAHRTLFSHRGTNDWAANWLCAFPIWSDFMKIFVKRFGSLKRASPTTPKYFTRLLKLRVKSLE